ncbi:Uncharacterized conserved protein [Fusobacterium necrophorum subsp. necrophorum]|nr:Uncharacterized conserved protein [Fusobacterium necrophorum subsp. necrophorum]
MEEAELGKDFHVIASDPAFANDVQAWVKASGNHLYEVKKKRALCMHTYPKGISHFFENQVIETKKE